MPYKKSYRRPRRKIARRRMVGKKQSVPKSIKRYVKRTIAQNAENKFLISRGTNVQISTAVGVTPTAISLLPSLASGSSRHTRVGNSIKLKKGFISGRVNLLPYSSLTNPNGCPIAVKMWLLSSKAYNEIGAFSGTPAATAFFKSDTSPAGMSGNVLDLTQSVDTENFIVYAQKTVVLGTSAATNNFPSTSVDAYTANSFSAPFYFNWSKHVKSLKYNDTSSSSIPTNRNLWLVFQAVSLDGRTVSTFSGNIITQLKIILKICK